MINVAEQLAKALDAENYLSARKLMANTCHYEIRGEVIVGADAIIKSYEVNGEAGRKRFDKVIYESTVSGLGLHSARIDYTDIVTHGSDTHVHRCAQEVTWNDAGQITEVRHLDLPGEVEALAAFKKAHPED